MEKMNINNLTFRDFIRPIFRQKLVIIIAFIVIVPITYIGLLSQTRVYEARVLIQIKGVSRIAAPTYEGLGGFSIHLTQMSIVKSNPVIKRAVKALKLDERPLDYEKNFCHPLKKYWIVYKAKKEAQYISTLPAAEKDQYMLRKSIAELNENITTALEPNTDLFRIYVHDYDPFKAVEIANVVSRSYTIYDLQQQLAELTLKYGDLHPTVQQLQDNIVKMTSNLHGKEISDMDSIGTASVKIIEQATTEFKPAGRPKSILMIIGVMVSAFIGIALAFVFDMLNHSFKSPDEITQYLNIPPIGSIPKKRLIDRQLISDTTSTSTYTEFYNDLSDQIFIFMKVQNLKTLLFLSVTPQSANMAITANLGVFLSQNNGLNTLVVDANVAKPTLQKLLKLDEKPGFANILEDTTLNINELLHSVNQNMHVLQTGTISENTVTILNESKIKTIIKKLKSSYDGVLIDCTFMRKLSDIAMLSSSVDGVILIINEGKDHIQVTRSVVHALKLNKANIIGGILNNRTFPIPSWLYKRI